MGKKIEYGEFKEKVAEALREELGAGSIISFPGQEDADMYGMYIQEKEGDVPAYRHNLEPFHELYRKPSDIKLTAKDASRTYRNYLTYRIMSGELDDWGQVSERVMADVVPMHRQGFLEGLPHRDIPHLKLSEACYYPAGYVAGREAGIRIENRHLRMWGIREEELLERAEKNTPDTYLISVFGTDGKLYELTDLDLSRPCKKALMYTVRNSERLSGAVCLLQDKVWKELAAYTGSGLYILPSSVEEVFAVPTEKPDKGHAEKLKHMVKDINRTVLQINGEFASHVYYYGRQEGKISLLI